MASRGPGHARTARGKTPRATASHTRDARRAPSRDEGGAQQNPQRTPQKSRAFHGTHPLYYFLSYPSLTVASKPVFVCFFLSDDCAAQGALCGAPMPSLADHAHTATHAASALRALVHLSLAHLSTTNSIRLRVAPDSLIARARRPDRGAADRLGPDHPRERRDLDLALGLVRQRRGESARRARAEADRGEARPRTRRFGAAEDRAICSQTVVGRKDIDRRCCTGGAHIILFYFSLLSFIYEQSQDGGMLVPYPFPSLLSRLVPFLMLIILRGPCLCYICFCLERLAVLALVRCFRSLTVLGV
jgi:hypothetical protein